MQTMAKFRFGSAPQGRTSPSEQFEAIEKVISDWAATKFSSTEDGMHVIRRTGAPAQFDSQFRVHDGQRLRTYLTMESVPTGELFTSVKMHESDEWLSFSCTISVESSLGIVPTNTPIYSPRFVRKILDIPFEWRTRLRGERIFRKPFRVGADDVPTLWNLLTSADRRLPVVALSELDGQLLTDGLDQCINDDLSGLVHTVRLSSDAAWEMTLNYGREWSCYNGAVRLYWPFQQTRNAFRSHPLWTLDNLLRSQKSESEAANRVRGSLREQVIAASTFRPDDPALSAFERDAERSVLTAAIAQASADHDYSKLERLYADDNDRLRERISTLETANSELQARIEYLTLVSSSRPTFDQSEEAVPVEEAPPQTVREAVDRFKRTHGDTVEIASETDGDIEHLNETAGPPEKILRYLDALALLSERISSEGSVGMSIPVWLRDRNVDCSVDSETDKNSKKAKAFRTRAINGTERECQFHLKPSDATSPDMCARIYFTVTDDYPHVRVGYIGRHAQ